MGIFTNLTRMWLTRSVRPFTFANELDQTLPYEDCEGLGLYIHIPFCRSLCDFCPYCKTVYDRELCDRYVDALIRELHMVGGRVPGKREVTSLYFGGGTPALAAGRLAEIIAAVEEHFIVTEGRDRPPSADPAGGRRHQNQHRDTVLPDKIPVPSRPETGGPVRPVRRAAGGSL